MGHSGQNHAINLYRGSLLTQLGYDFKPETPNKERRIWSAINYKFSFPDDQSYPELPYKNQATSLLVEPSFVTIAHTRTVSPSAEDLMVKITIVNNDPAEYDATNVILSDDVPARPDLRERFMRRGWSICNAL